MMDERPQLTAKNVSFTETHIMVYLSDGRAIAVPLWWYPRLNAATPEQRQIWRLIGGGIGICWDEIDEDLSVRGMLSEAAGPAPKAQKEDSP